LTAGHEDGRLVDEIGDLRRFGDSVAVQQAERSTDQMGAGVANDLGWIGERPLEGLLGNDGSRNGCSACLPTSCNSIDITAPQLGSSARWAQVSLKSQVSRPASEPNGQPVSSLA